jgi:hypothetical protein
MIRQEWTFKYKIAEIAEAARKKEEYHSQRELFWLERYNNAFAKMEKDGIKLQKVPRIERNRGLSLENIGYSNAGGNRYNTGVDLHAVLDQSLQHLLQAYQTKYSMHKTYTDQYRQYRMTLESRPGTDVKKLDIDDVSWFGLNGERITEEDEQDDEEIANLETDAGLEQKVTDEITWPLIDGPPDQPKKKARKE